MMFSVAKAYVQKKHNNDTQKRAFRATTAIRREPHVRSLFSDVYAPLPLVELSILDMNSAVKLATIVVMTSCMLVLNSASACDWSVVTCESDVVAGVWEMVVSGWDVVVGGWDMNEGGTYDPGGRWL